MKNIYLLIVFQEVPDTLEYVFVLFALLDHHWPCGSHSDDSLPGRGHLAQEGRPLDLLHDPVDSYQGACPAHACTAVYQDWGWGGARSRNINLRLRDGEASVTS